MKQFQADMNNLSCVSNQGPRSSLILAIQRESKQLEALEKENRDLRIALEDHQNALELIMSKYRQQVSQLVKYNVACQRLHELNSSCCCSDSSLPQNSQGKQNRAEQPQPSLVPQTSQNTVKHNKKVFSNCSSTNSSPGSSSGSVKDLSKQAIHKEASSQKSQSTHSLAAGPHVSLQNHLLNMHKEKIMEMAAVMMKAVDLDEAVASRDQERLAQLQLENQGLRELLDISRINSRSSLLTKRVSDKSVIPVETVEEVKESSGKAIQADHSGINGQRS